MTHTFTLHLSEGFDEYEGLSESKGWVRGNVGLTDGRQYVLYFVTLERLSQDAAEELGTAGFYSEENLVLVPSTHRPVLERAVREMLDCEFFDRLHEASQPSAKE